MTFYYTILSTLVIFALEKELTDSFSDLPGLNTGTRRAATIIVSPVRGFLPCLSALFLTPKLPKPGSTTVSPLFNASVIDSNIASTAVVAYFLDIPSFSAICSISSLFFISDLLLSCFTLHPSCPKSASATSSSGNLNDVLEIIEHTSIFLFLSRRRRPILPNPVLTESSFSNHAFWQSSPVSLPVRPLQPTHFHLSVV